MMHYFLKVSLNENFMRVSRVLNKLTWYNINRERDEKVSCDEISFMKIKLVYTIFNTYES